MVGPAVHPLPAGPRHVDEHAWRFEQLRSLGVSAFDSLRLSAKRGVHHDLKELLDRGCPLDVALRIVDY